MLLLSLTATCTPLSLLLTTFSKTTTKTRPFFFRTMTTQTQTHAFAGNPIKQTQKPTDPFTPSSALTSLKTHLSSPTQTAPSPNFKVLPFRKGRPLAGSANNPTKSSPKWHLGWLSLGEWKGVLGNLETEVFDDGNGFVFLGAKADEDLVYWGVDVGDDGRFVDQFGKKFLSFVELRTLMVATDWSDPKAMAELAVAGHARALLEWHGITRFCGNCGCKTVPMEAGRRMECSNVVCKKRIYPRVDPVVIMLVIDRENDRALLSRQSRFVPRMWSCLAGFIEPGESLEEAVRRETWEETGIEVGEVIYHSSQPWPVGPSSMPCQLMVGFFAYAKSLEINVDKNELEDAQWHSREDVKKALTFAEYEKAQRTAATKVDEMCKGVKQDQNLSSDFNKESGELAAMFVPGPFAIAHHLISTWAFQGVVSGSETRLKFPGSSVSNL